MYAHSRPGAFISASNNSIGRCTIETASFAIFDHLNVAIFSTSLPILDLKPGAMACVVVTDFDVDDYQCFSTVSFDLKRGVGRAVKHRLSRVRGSG